MRMTRVSTCSWNVGKFYQTVKLHIQAPEAFWMWGGQEVWQSVHKIFKPHPLINGNAFVRLMAKMKNLVWLWLRADRRLLQTGKIDKFTVFCLAQGKSGCVSREKVGGGGAIYDPPGPPNSDAYELSTERENLRLFHRLKNCHCYYSSS